MAERKPFKYVISTKMVRDLLGEHQAPFPYFYLLPPEDEHWPRCRGGQIPEGLCRYDAGLNLCAIYLRADGYASAYEARVTIIHELRHWWQDHTARKVNERLSGLYLKRLFIECAVVVVVLLMIVLGLLFGCTDAAGLGVLLFEVVVFVSLVYTSALGGVLYCWFGRLPLKYAWLEHDAARFTKTNRGCPKWREAIVIEKID